MSRLLVLAVAVVALSLPAGAQPAPQPKAVKAAVVAPAPVVTFAGGVLTVLPDPATKAGLGVVTFTVAPGDPLGKDNPVNQPVADVIIGGSGVAVQTFTSTKQIVVVGGDTGTNNVSVDCNVPATLTGGAGFNVLFSSYGRGSVLVGGSGLNQLFSRGPDTLVNCGPGTLILALNLGGAGAGTVIGRPAGSPPIFGFPAP